MNTNFLLENIMTRVIYSAEALAELEKPELKQIPGFAKFLKAVRNTVIECAENNQLDALAKDWDHVKDLNKIGVVAVNSLLNYNKEFWNVWEFGEKQNDGKEAPSLHVMFMNRGRHYLMANALRINGILNYWIVSSIDSIRKIEHPSDEAGTWGVGEVMDKIYKSFIVASTTLGDSDVPVLEALREIQ